MVHFLLYCRDAVFAWESGSLAYVKNSAGGTLDAELMYEMRVGMQFSAISLRIANIN